MKPSDRTEWIRDHRCKADDAIRTITSAKKQRVSEYDERLRKLKDFAEVLFIKQTDLGQQEMFDPKEILAPDLTDLLAAPLKGLD